MSDRSDLHAGRSDAQLSDPKSPLNLYSQIEQDLRRVLHSSTDFKQPWSPASADPAGFLLFENDFAQTITAGKIPPPFSVKDGIGGGAEFHLSADITFVPLDWGGGDNSGLQSVDRALRDKASLLPEDERKNFLDNITKLEKRIPPLSELEVVKTMQSILKLMTTESSVGVTLADRLSLASQILDYSANPQHVTQGAFNTCAAAAVEIRMFTTHPSDAADLIANIALSGSYTCDAGISITADPQFHDGFSRSFASEIFQTAATNLVLSQGKPPRKYTVDVDTSRKPPVLTEHIEHIPFDSDLDPTPWTGLSMDQISNMNYLLTGSNDLTCLVNVASSDSKDSAIDVFSTQDEFEAYLVKLQASGSLPAVLHVDIGNEPFWNMFSQRTAGGHAITITGYDKGPPSMIEIDNPWGDKMKVPAHQLYLATFTANSNEQISQMQKDIDNQRKIGKVDLDEELELIRHELLNGKVSETEIKNQFSVLLEDAKTQGLSSTELGRFTDHLLTTLHKVSSPGDQLDLELEAFNDGLIEKARMEIVIGNTAYELLKSNTVSSEQAKQNLQSSLAELDRVLNELAPDLKMAIEKDILSAQNVTIKGTTPSQVDAQFTNFLTAFESTIQVSDQSESARGAEQNQAHHVD